MEIFFNQYKSPRSDSSEISSMRKLISSLLQLQMPPDSAV